MGTIIQRTFSGVPDKGFSLGSFSENTVGVGEVLTRRLGWGSDWKVVRMGILCCLGEYPDQAYDRNSGFFWGCSSGSRTIFDNVSNVVTCIGVSYGNIENYYGSFDTRATFQQHISSGSFFFFDDYSTIHYSSSIGSIKHYSGANVAIANSGDPIKRRSLLMLELSSSRGTVYFKQYSMHSSSMDSKFANRDYTEEDLKAILTSSVFPTASGIPMDSIVKSTKYNTTLYPLDSAFIGSFGSIPLEIYNWYVYKIK